MRQPTGSKARKQKREKERRARQVLKRASRIQRAGSGTIRPRSEYRQPARQDKHRFLIVCEGTKTEPNYFRAFGRRSDVDVDVVGVAQSPQRVVNAAFDKLGEAPDAYDQVWCVFDKDSFKDDEFDNAIESARALFRKSLKSKNPDDLRGAAYSNEAFELWYVLHFESRVTAMPRTDFEKALTKHMGRDYKKNDPGMLRLLSSKMNTAMTHAESLWRETRDLPPHKANPSTTVHLLVRELMANARP